MTIQRITNDDERKRITRTILEGLPDWFGIPEAREEYIEASQGKPFFCAYEAGEPVGFLYLKETGKDTMELAVMGVQEKHHRQGIGRSLFEQAKKKRHVSDIPFCRSKPCRWASMRAMTEPTGFTSPWAFRNWKSSPHYGTNGTHVRFISWLWKNGIFPEKIVPSPAPK